MPWTRNACASGCESAGRICHRSPGRPLTIFWPPDRRFCVLPAGRVGAQADSELLANGVLAGRVRDWRAKFDVVLFDSPPLLPSADARILAGHMDGMILVVRQNHCRRDAIGDALTHVQHAGTPLLGLVFVGHLRGSRYGHYGRYGAYTADEFHESKSAEVAAR